MKHFFLDQITAAEREELLKGIDSLSDKTIRHALDLLEEIEFRMRIRLILLDNEEALKDNQSRSGYES